MPKLLMQNVENPLSVENFKTVRTNIQFALENCDDKCFAVTSSKPSEGKSYITTNLGIVFAIADCKTIVLDLDLRRKTQHIKMGVENKEGMVNILMNKEFEDEEYIANNIEKYIQNTEFINLDVITAGECTSIPPELLMKPRFNKIVEYLKTKYDYVILDTPPINVVADTSIVCKKRNVVVVTSMNETEIPLLKNTIGTLRDIKANILGVVINKVPTEEGKYCYNKYNSEYTSKYASKYVHYLVPASQNKPSIIKRKFCRLIDLTIALTTLPFTIPMMIILSLLSKKHKIQNIFVRDVVRNKYGIRVESLKFDTSKIPHPDTMKKVKRNDYVQFLEDTKLKNLPHIYNYINGDLSFIKKIK